MVVAELEPSGGHVWRSRAGRKIEEKGEQSEGKRAGEAERDRASASK
jgi:hypothetical protein